MQDEARLDGFRWLETVDQAFEAMLPAIESARHSIRLEVYIYRVSPIGEKVREILMRALRRGVEVKVLVDALGSITLPDRFWDPFIEAGGQFRWFNPIKLQRLGFRDHRKMLVIDDRLAFVGGFNIAPEYQGDGVTKGWHDLGLQVPESMARELAASFDVVFGLADYRHHRFARYRRATVAKVAETPEGQIITSAPGRGPHFMNRVLLADCQRAPRLDIISAYFLPPRQLRRALMQAARHGRPVRLILAGKSDVALSQLASRHLYKGLLTAGVRIFEYQPQILHSKLFFFGDVFYIGSANMDKRSLLVNYELLVRVQNAALAREGQAVFDKALEHSRPIQLDEWRASRTFWSRLREKYAFWMLSRVDPYLTRLQLEVLYREIRAKRRAQLAR